MTLPSGAEATVRLRVVDLDLPAPPDIDTGYPSLESESLARRVGTKAWRRLPVRAPASVGDRVYRYL